MVESPTLPWSSLSCFEATPTIQVCIFAVYLICIVLICRGLFGRAGPLPIKGNKLLRSLGYQSNPQGALLQAEWHGAEGEVGRFGLTPAGVGVNPPRRGAPDR